MMKLRIALHGILAGSLGIQFNAGAASPPVDADMRATCGCCGKWLEHMQSHGYAVITRNAAVPPSGRERTGAPQAPDATCDAAKASIDASDNRAPGKEVKQLSNERPPAKAATAQPKSLGSPGMADERNDAYDILLIHKSGNHSSYRSSDRQKERKSP